MSDEMDDIRRLVQEIMDQDSRQRDQRLASAIARHDQEQAHQRSAAHDQSRRLIWASAASAALANPHCPDADSAALAGDEILARFDERWPQA